MNNLLLELQNIYKEFDNKTILKNVSLSIYSGKIIGIVGDNGLGKTTLLRIMANILKPDSGRIIKNNTYISYVPKIEEFSKWMRVKDILFFYDTYYYNFDLSKSKKLIAESEISTQDKIHKLSSGQQEKLFLILSLSQNAQLYLMDEPFNGLDPFFKKDVRQFLLKNIPDNSTIVMATHLLRDLEQLFDEIVFFTSSGINKMLADDIRQNFNRSIEEYYLEVIHNDKNKY